MADDESWRAPAPPLQRHEPVFILKATDPFAAALVTLWIGLARLRLGEGHPKVIQARQRLAQMESWQAEHGTRPGETLVSTHPD